MGKSKKFVEKKEIKVSKILSGISNLENGDSITPTALAKKIGVHYSTLIEKIDEYDLTKQVCWRTIRDKNKKIKLIIKSDDDLIIRTALIEIKKDILSLKIMLDEIGTKLKKKK